MSAAAHLAITLGAPARVADAERLLASAASPGLPPADLGFVDALIGRCASFDELAELDLAGLLLAYQVINGELAAVAQLLRLLDALRAPLRRTGADAQQIDDLLAELPAELASPRASSAPRIAGYSGRGALGGWLRIVAVRMLVERRRKQGLAIDDDAVADLAAPDLDPQLALLRRQYAVEFKDAFAVAIAALPAQDRLLLRQHHLDGLGIDQLAVLHGCHRATAARRLVAVRETVFDAVRRRLLSELRIGGATFESLVRLVRSELDLSIDRYLG